MRNAANREKCLRMTRKRRKIYKNGENSFYFIFCSYENKMQRATCCQLPAASRLPPSPIVWRRIGNTVTVPAAAATTAAAAAAVPVAWQKPNKP